MSSTVYGPVKSWRYGMSLGIDLIRDTSVCSFNCIYCQLGDIQIVTTKRKLFIPTAEVIKDLESVNMDEVDIVAFSGSGEPTLALNIGEVITHIQKIYEKPVMILTNGTLFNDPYVRKRVSGADIIDCKLDVASEKVLKQYNRPAEGITFQSIFEGLKILKKEFNGKLHIQCMFMPANLGEAEKIAENMKSIQPDLVQINTPKRPYPKEWYPEARGRHGENPPVPHSNLRNISLEKALKIEELFRNAGLTVQSVYKK